MENNVYMVIFLVFVGFTARDLMLGWSQNSGADASDEDLPVKKEIPSMTFKAQPNGPTLKILYCYSCGYRRAFEEYSTLIRERFPDLNIVGDNYTPGMGRNKLVQLISVFKLALMALLISNINPFTHFGMNTPRIWFWMTQHKVWSSLLHSLVLLTSCYQMYACMMLFFLSNTIESQLMSSGAFEVFYNGMLFGCLCLEPRLCQI